MGVPFNVSMSKIMHTPIKVGVRTYATYANCQTLPQCLWPQNLAGWWLTVSGFYPKRHMTI